MDLEADIFTGKWELILYVTREWRKTEGEKNIIYFKYTLWYFKALLRGLSAEKQ